MPGEAFQLSRQVFQIPAQGFEQNVKVVLRAFQPQNLVLRLAALALGGTPPSSAPRTCAAWRRS